MSEIRGNTSTIKAIAGTIRDDAASYGTSQDTLFQAVNALKGSFTSEDGQNYISKINSFKTEFETLKRNLEGSAEALETAAVNYENTIKANMG